MRLALIPPVEMLDYTAETNMQLMLPHLTEFELYRYTYLQHCKNPRQYVILDNGIAEGVHTPPERLMNIAKAFDVNEIVLPDEIQDAELTKKASLDFLDKHADLGFQYMFVVQGKTMKEFVDSACWAATEPRIDVIGIPRHMITTLRDQWARLRLAEILFRESVKPIHLLGASPLHPTELKATAWKKTAVRSTDTSSPFNFAYNNLQLRAGNNASRPEGYFQLPWAAFSERKLKQLDKNILLLKEWTEG